jgi:uncharacterized protein (TIGR01777 family)
VRRSQSFHWHTTLPHPIDEVFAWHTRLGAFERLNAPWRPVVVVRASGSISPGAQVEIRVPLVAGLGIPWHLTHTAYDPPRLFRDEQTQGPFRSWKHSHLFTAQGTDVTTLCDEIEYELPRGVGFLNSLFQRELERLFAHRHATLALDLTLHARWHDKPRKTILIAGASGFVGRALRAFLETAGHTVRTLVRRNPIHPSEFSWDPSSSILDPRVFADIDAVINLCGENIASGRWNARRKARIEQSRVQTTSLLAQTIATLPTPPEVFICASGAGFYGDTGDTLVDENHPQGADFLARVCGAWEGAAAPLLDTSCRILQLRIGMVLNAAGGALAKMIPAFQCGLGGKLGSGEQYISWIGLEDLLGICEHALYSPDLRGPVNCVSPDPCSNREFTKCLAKVIWRPAVIPAPAALLKVAFGEMAQLFLASSRIHPKKLLSSGYHFVHGSLSEALRFECGR